MVVSSPSRLPTTGNTPRGTASSGASRLASPFPRRATPQKEPSSSKDSPPKPSQTEQAEERPPCSDDEKPGDVSAKERVAGQLLPDRVLVYARCRPALDATEDCPLAQADQVPAGSSSPAAFSSQTFGPSTTSASCSTPRSANLNIALTPQPSDKKVAMCSLDGSPIRDNRSFVFDGVFDGASSQTDVYTAVARPVLREVLCGYHGCIMAYGQTGSGKTHSLLHPGSSGDLSQAGLVPRLAADLFTQTEADGLAKYEVNIGMFQIYNEQVDDLLVPDNNSLKIKPEQTRNDRNAWYVDGLSWRPVESAAALLECLAAARKRLIYAETKMNKHSSRSHCVVVIKVVRQEVPASMLSAEGKREAKDQASVKVRQTMGQLTIVDLAGSERVKKSAAQDKRLKEAININTSLLMLGNVIQSLAARLSHVPFRDSSLTRMLESSLSGNSRCAMLICLAPEPSHLSESLSTLEFASRAMRVQTRPVLHESTVEMDPSELASHLAGQFESDVAMRSQVELMQLKHALDQQVQKSAEASRRAKGASAQIEGMQGRLAEESVARTAAEAEVRELLRQLEAKNVSLKKAQLEREAAQARSGELERALAEARAAAEASGASTAAARDAARLAKEASAAVSAKLEQEVARRKLAEAAVDEIHAEAERRQMRLISTPAQTDTVDYESSDEDGPTAQPDHRRQSFIPSLSSAGAGGYKDPMHKIKELKQQLHHLKEELKQKTSMVNSLQKSLQDSSDDASQIIKDRDDLEEQLFQELQKHRSIAADSERKTEKLSQEWERIVLRTGIVCTKRGRNNKDYTRVIRMSDDMSTLEWAAVKEFKPGFKVQDVELGSHDVQRHVTTIKGSSRSTSIVPKGHLQEQWVAALSRQFRGSKDYIGNAPGVVEVRTDPEMRPGEMNRCS